MNLVLVVPLVQRLSRISGTTGGTLRTTQVAESYQVRWSHYEIIINIRLFLDFPDLEQLRWEKVYQLFGEYIQQKTAANQGIPSKPPRKVFKAKQNLLDWAMGEMDPGRNRDPCAKLFNLKPQVGFMVDIVFSTQH